MVDLVKERKDKEKSVTVLRENTKKANETLMMLKEEKDSTEREIVNLISHKESLEEIIKNYSIFINEYSIRESLANLEKEIDYEFYSYEIESIDKISLVRNISGILADELKINLINNKSFASLCLNALKLFSLNKTLESTDIFLIFSKKVYEFFLYNSETKDLIENTEKIHYEVYK